MLTPVAPACAAGPPAHAQAASQRGNSFAPPSALRACRRACASRRATRAATPVATRAASAAEATLMRWTTPTWSMHAAGTASSVHTSETARVASQTYG
eukprot:54260-Chlamydomonas_euryale.AAC.1